MIGGGIRTMSGHNPRSETSTPMQKRSDAMKLPLQITFRNMEPSDAVAARIAEKARKLDHFCNRIMACHVVFEAQHQHHYKGNLFHVRIDLTVPDREIVISRDPGQHHAHEDAYVAIRDAFNAARRQLEQYNQKRQQHVKTHVPPLTGRIIELHPEKGYGRIETADGQLIYFHRNSVLKNNFEQLDIGSEVRFDQEAGDLGPQASTVKPLNKLHPA